MCLTLIYFSSLLLLSLLIPFSFEAKKIKVPFIVKSTQTISLTVSVCAALQRRELFLLITPLISLPTLLNSFPLFPPPFPATHLALTYNCCEPRRKHNGRLTVCVCECRCVSLGAFDPIKTLNLDG